MELLTIKDNIAIPSPYILTIMEFNALVKRDRDRSVKELAYVYFMCDHHSPFSVYDEEKRKEEVKLNIFGSLKLRIKYFHKIINLLFFKSIVNLFNYFN